MRIAILGRTHWLLGAAEELVRAGHQIVFVASAPAAAEYRVDASHFANLAASSGSPFHENPDLNASEYVEMLKASGAEVGVSVNWPKILRREACSALRHGILNAHAGDLPRYRGNACPNWAILRGESHVGLCIHVMEPGAVDSGPIVCRAQMELGDDTDIADVYSWLDDAIPRQFAVAVSRIGAPGFKAEIQGDSGVRPLRCHPRRPSDARIDWSDGDVHVNRLVRASGRPFGGAYSFLEGETRVTIWKAMRASMDHDFLAVPGQIMGRGPYGGVIVACGSGAIEIVEHDLIGGGRLPTSNAFRLCSR